LKKCRLPSQIRLSSPAPEPTPEAALPPEPEPVLVEEAPATAAAGSLDGDDPVVATEVIEELVTDDTARSATEDFTTTVSGRDRSGQQDDRGLSNFEKALIVGLGAVAVGTLLNNGNRVVANSGDRVVVQDDRGVLTVLKDEDALLRQPGSRVRTETFDDGSSRTFVTREDGSRIETILAADGRVLRRSRILPDGTEFLLFDDTIPEERIDVTRLPTPAPALTLADIESRDTDALARALERLRAEDAARVNEARFSLRQVREIRPVRELAPEIEVKLTFATGSSAIAPDQAGRLLALGQAMGQLIAANPREVFLVEGHTDAVGAAEFNLALSDRRAESVALALTQFFGVPPENMVVQGYGESALLVPTLAAEERNRRATVRRITPLLREVVASR
jgi:outer membrane protein OmpA-like peptidoglycan-associated protein